VRLQGSGLNIAWVKVIIAWVKVIIAWVKVIIAWVKVMIDVEYSTIHTKQRFLLIHS
jgi:hypothetical protein